MSHDWPNGIEPYGNMRDLFRRKPHFRRDFEEGRLGSKPLMPLLQKLKPYWWFAAHMHCRFEATVVHEPRWQVGGGDSASGTLVFSLQRAVPG